ncbi:MAG: hypothetical protein Unbinned4234contig1002_36 [Prokaryotic dsDNA virus sp.]|nr:MAG: hypothetical protein Unbinned4234contig1002_36 [Prokaryotic dsDNA virus sp.]|tara:strand:- start:1878 stop:2867 length:990 start_codon:yes stop_codon:yes gene_type:complete
MSIEPQQEMFELPNLEKIAFQYARKRGMPYYFYNDEEKLLEFKKIQQSKFKEGIVGGEVLQLFHGIGLAWSYFPHHWEVQVGKKKRPIDVFYNDELLLKALRSRIKWGGKVGEKGFMTDANLRKAIRTASGVQAVSNFRPVAAASIYHKYAGNGIVWDMSCGYGGRLLGALACGRVKKYIGTEPCTKTFNGLINIKKDFEDLGVEIEINQLGSENFIPSEPVDLCFTSPPYFNTEEYSQEETQSFKKYPTKEGWLNGFLRKTLSNCHKSLKNNGLLILNIANVKQYNNLEEDALNVAHEEGFHLQDIIKLRLSSINGGFKYEPIFIFKT